MKRELTLVAAWLTAAVAVGAMAAPDKPPTVAAATQQAEGRYAVTGAVKLGGEGPWGHVAQDAEGKRLYVLSTDWMRVMDSMTGKTVAEIGVGNGARGVTLVPEVGRGFVSNGFGQTVTVFDLKTNAVLGAVSADHGTEALAYDPMSKRILLVAGNSLVSFAADMDLKTGKAAPPIDLDGSAMALVPDGHGMVYLTLVNQDQVALVAVVDTREMRLVTTWPLTPGCRPMGLALDSVHSRLFVGTSAGVVVLSATDGHEIATVPVKDGVDATAFFDGQVFASSASGTFTVIGKTAEGHYEIQQTFPTGSSGAYLNGSNPNNAMIMNPQTGAIYLPASGAPPGGGGARFKLLVLEKK